MSRVAFVSGATGYTGREVVRLAAEAGLTTVAHVRPDSRELDGWRERFGALGATVDATPWDEDAMADTLARLKPDVVFALLGTTRARARATARAGGDPDAETYEAVDYGLTALLLRAIGRAGVQPRFVYLSSLGASATSANAYLRARGRLEAELTASGLPFTVARPSFITGPDRDEPRPLERVGATVADGALSLVRALGARRVADRYASTDAATLAEALVAAALAPDAAGRVLEGAELRRRI